MRVTHNSPGKVHNERQGTNQWKRMSRTSEMPGRSESARDCRRGRRSGPRGRARERRGDKRKKGGKATVAGGFQRIAGSLEDYCSCTCDACDNGRQCCNNVSGCYYARLETTSPGTASEKPLRCCLVAPNDIPDGFVTTCRRAGDRQGCDPGRLAQARYLLIRDWRARDDGEAKRRHERSSMLVASHPRSQQISAATAPAPGSSVPAETNAPRPHGRTCHV
jgi:hypothetical protein